MSISPDVFERIESEPVADIVVQQIENLIVQGVLSQGDRLPSERELSAQLNVSRPKLRDALKVLEQSKLITVRHGEGTFISKLTGQAMEPALIELYARHGQAFYDYLEYRRAQEGLAAQLAAERATATDRAQIQRHLDALVQAENLGDDMKSQEIDVKFHASIVEASHNAMLIHMMASIYELTQRGVFYNRNYLRLQDGSSDKLLQQHKDIAAAVLDRDTLAALAASNAHMDFVEKSFRLGQKQTDCEVIARKRVAAKGEL